MPNSRTYFLMKTSEIGFEKAIWARATAFKIFGGVIFILMVILCVSFYI